MNLPILLINLAESQARLKKSKHELSKHKLSFERIEAVDGRKISTNELEEVALWDKWAFFKPLSPGEVGCYLSHISAAKRIVEEGWPRALVLEDDFLLCDNFKERIADLLSRGDAVADIIKLEGVRAGGEVISTLADGARVLRNRRPPSRTIAQLWTNQGAKKFLANSGVIYRPVDVQIKHWWELQIDVLHVSPPMITDGDSTGKGSTIGARPARGLMSRLYKIRYKISFALQCHWYYIQRWGAFAWFRAGLR